MSASLIGRLGSSTFNLSTTAVSMSLAGSRSLWNRHQGPSIMGVEDEAEQSSIVPRGTSFHRLVELKFPPFGFEAARFSCCSYGLLPGPAEFGAVNPYAPAVAPAPRSPFSSLGAWQSTSPRPAIE